MSAKSKIDSTAADDKSKIPQIPGYTIEDRLGNGAMAAVYLALQNALERRVALKVMATSLSIDDTFQRRFLKEGKIIGQLNHPHIITVYDIGEYEHHYYMAMEYIGGGTLKERIDQGMPIQRAVNIVCQIAEALGYAHGRGFVHRDVKPANILFRDEDTAVLSDFGIARGFDENTRLTMAGWTLGTPNYMSPEQALGKTLDARSDLYALGVVFYEMLTGARPYQATDSIALALKHVSEPIPRLPEELTIYQGIIDRLLAKDPNDRFAHAEDLVAAVTQVYNTGRGLPASATTESKLAGGNSAASEASSRPAGFGSQRWHWLAAGAALLLLLGTGFYVFMPESQQLPNGSNMSPRTATPVDEETEIRNQIASHLRIANANLNIGFLISPYNLNAAHGYCQVLQLEPDNTAARQGLDEVAQAYAQQPETNLDELNLALGMLQNCLQQLPGHPGLLTLRARVQQQLGQNP